MRRPDNGKEGEFGQADDEGRAFDAAIGSGADDDQEGHCYDRQGKTARYVVQLADAGDRGEFGDQRADGRRGKAGRGQRGPAETEPVADQFAVPAPSVDAEPDRQLLHHVEHGDQDQYQRQQAIAPLDASLGGGHHVAGIGIGQHNQQPGAPDSDCAEQGGGFWSGELGFGAHAIGQRNQFRMRRPHDLARSALNRLIICCHEAEDWIIR